MRCVVILWSGEHHKVKEINSYRGNQAFNLRYCRCAQAFKFRGCIDQSDVVVGRIQDDQVCRQCTQNTVVMRQTCCPVLGGNYWFHSLIIITIMTIIIIIFNNTRQYVWCCHHDSESLREFSRFTRWMQNSAGHLPTFGPSWQTWATGPPVGC